MQHIHAIRQCKTDTFEYGAGDIGGTMLMGQTKQCAFGIRIVMGCAFAGKIRQEPHR
ncbi:hypothetical protein D3C80_2185450 [compost metagenome]